MNDDTMHLIAGNANRPLAEAIARRISVYQGRRVNLTSARVERFNDSEIFVEIYDNVRGQDVFIIQPTSSPANDNLMELLIITDALKRASARSITAVMPYFGYARQDRKTSARTPISAKLVADLIQQAGVTRILTMDLHAGQIQGFFDIPADNLYAAPVFALDLKHNNAGDLGRCAVVSPDVGGVLRARDLAKRLDAGLAVVDKRRGSPGEIESMTVIGEVKDRICIIVDDICDTAGTLCSAAELLMQKGASEVHAYISHGVLSDPAVERISNSALKSLVVTDSIEAKAEAATAPNIRIVSIAPLFAQAILNVKNDTSVSSLFDEEMLGPIYEAFYRFD
ncbi:MAG TPA: ribose-phosphate pyrophosphokinase [Paracoccaceae bacterium]|nr:ribose-phosphate pyrophosphokinase [Paracoccaceae bacterium]